MRELILLRGLPGAGKSTLATVLAEDRYPVYSVDDFFTNKSNNEYHFQFEKNHLAYKQCIENTERSMNEGEKKIFVDNTFTLDWEIEPYLKLAQQYRYRVHVMTVEKYHGGSNVHAVSDEMIVKMAAKYKVKLL